MRVSAGAVGIGVYASTILLHYRCDSLIYVNGWRKKKEHLHILVTTKYMYTTPKLL